MTKLFIAERDKVSQIFQPLLKERYQIVSPVHGATVELIMINRDGKFVRNEDGSIKVISSTKSENGKFSMDLLFHNVKKDEGQLWGLLVTNADDSATQLLTNKKFTNVFIYLFDDVVGDININLVTSLVHIQALDEYKKGERGFEHCLSSAREMIAVSTQLHHMGDISNINYMINDDISLLKLTCVLSVWFKAHLLFHFDDNENVIDFYQTFLENTQSIFNNDSNVEADTLNVIRDALRNFTQDSSQTNPPIYDTSVIFANVLLNMKDVSRNRLDNTSSSLDTYIKLSGTSQEKFDDYVLETIMRFPYLSL